MTKPWRDMLARYAGAPASYWVNAPMMAHNRLFEAICQVSKLDAPYLTHTMSAMDADADVQRVVFAPSDWYARERFLPALNREATVMKTAAVGPTTVAPRWTCAMCGADVEPGMPPHTHVLDAPAKFTSELLAEPLDLENTRAVKVFKPVSGGQS